MTSDVTSTPSSWEPVNVVAVSLDGLEPSPSLDDKIEHGSDYVRQTHGSHLFCHS